MPPSNQYAQITLLATLLLLLPVQQGQAGEVGETFDDLPVILTVTRLPQSIQETPAAVSIIDRAMIEASGAKEVPELLRLVAGFQVGHVNMLGPRATVTYHGLSDMFARRMQVLVDGRSVYTPATGGVNWYTLPVTLDDIERIEVIRGPNGVTHGANAFLGVINIITYHPNDVQGTKVKAVTGDGHYRRYLLRHADRVGNLTLSATAEYLGEDSNARFEEGIPGSSKDDKELGKVLVRGEYRAGINDYYSFNFGNTNATIGDGILGDITTPLHDNTVTDSTVQLKWKRLIDSEQDIQLNLYENRYSTDADYFIPRLSELFTLDPLLVEALFGEDSPIRIDHSIEMQRQSAELQHRLALDDSLQLVWGGELREDRLTSPGLIGANDPASTQLARVFVNGAWHATDHILFNAGAMVEDHSLTGLRLSPRVAVNRHIGKHHTIRAAHTIAYRTPALLEEYADYAARFAPSGVTVDQLWESAGALEPEKITSTELGLVGGSADQTLRYDVRIYREHIRDIISTPTERQSDEFASTIPGACALHSGFCTIQTKFFNDGSVDIEGIDLQLQAAIGSDTNLSLGYAYTEATGRMLDDVNDDVPSFYESIGTVAAVPRNTVSLLVSHHFPGQWQASLGWYYIDKFQFLGGDLNEELQTADLTLRKRFTDGGQSGAVTITLQDISGSYYDFIDIIPREHRLLFGLELQL